MCIVCLYNIITVWHWGAWGSCRGQRRSHRLWPLDGRGLRWHHVAVRLRWGNWGRRHSADVETPEDKTGGDSLYRYRYRVFSLSSERPSEKEKQKQINDQLAASTELSLPWQQQFAEKADTAVTLRGLWRRTVTLFTSPPVLHHWSLHQQRCQPIREQQKRKPPLIYLFYHWLIVRRRLQGEKKDESVDRGQSDIIKGNNGTGTSSKSDNSRLMAQEEGDHFPGSHKQDWQLLQVRSWQFKTEWWWSVSEKYKLRHSANVFILPIDHRANDTKTLTVLVISLQILLSQGLLLETAGTVCQPIKIWQIHSTLSAQHQRPDKQTFGDHPLYTKRACITGH